MVTTVISTLTTTGSSLATGDEYFLLEGVTHRANFRVIQATGADVEATIWGTLFSTTGAAIDDNGHNGFSLLIGQSGKIFSPYKVAGITTDGDRFSLFNNGEVTAGQIVSAGADFTLINTGTMIGSFNGINDVEFLNLVGSNAHVVNSGQIHSGSGQIAQLHAAGAHIDNSGTMSGVEDGIQVTSANADVTLVNSGHLSASDIAVEGHDRADTVANSGTIIGDINLGGGADVFRNIGGTIDGIVSGGSGDDTYYIDSDTIELNEFLLQGTDAVHSSVSYALNDNFEVLNLSGARDINGQGNNDANTVVGNAGDNRLRGHDGDDTLHGLAGDDTLKGQDDDDTMTGGRGNDRLLGGDGLDNLRGDRGDDALQGNRGNDTINGNNGDDALIGGGGRDRLNGGKDDDRLTGGGENDVFLFTNGFGRDTITDFDAKSNREDISLAGVASVTNWTDLRSNHLTQKGANVLIDAGGGNTILLKGVDIDDLHAADFLF